MHAARPRQKAQLYLPAGKSFLLCTVGCPAPSLEASLKRKQLREVLDADEDALLV